METQLEPAIGALVWYAGMLDGAPPLVRGLIAGALLVVLLRFAERRIAATDVQLRISFAKFALVTLAVVPLALCLLPAVHLAVLVEELLPAAPPHPLWLLPGGLWAVGLLIALLRLTNGYRQSLAALRALPTVADSDPLAARLVHWQRRLGRQRPQTLALAVAADIQQLPGSNRLLLPRAAAHWPQPAQDLLLIRAICDRSKRHAQWHLLARLLACCYWPVPWVGALGTRLLDDFEVATDSLARACYQDELGYGRALQQVRQRMPEAQRRQPATDGRRMARGYLTHLQVLWTPEPALLWNFGSLTDQQRHAVVWREPGEKLAWLVGHAALIAFLVGGMTLRQMPAEIERDYSLTLDPTWMNTAFRSRGNDARQSPGPAGGDGWSAVQLREREADSN